MGKNYEKKFSLRKRFLIPVIVLGAFLLSLFIYVSASSILDSERAKLDDSWVYKVYGDIGLRWPDSSTDSPFLFVPTKTAGEWNAFFGEKERLNIEDCTAVDGGWSDWTCESCKAEANPVCDSWMECGEVTDTDYYDRECTRSCTNPSPAFGGDGCGTDDYKTVECSDTDSKSCGSCPGECEFCTGFSCETSDSYCDGCCTCTDSGTCTCTDPDDSCGNCLWCSEDGTCENCEERIGYKYDHVWCENDECHGCYDTCQDTSDCDEYETCDYHWLDGAQWFCKSCK